MPAACCRQLHRTMVFLVLQDLHCKSVWLLRLLCIDLSELQVQLACRAHSSKVMSTELHTYIHTLLTTYVRCPVLEHCDVWQPDRVHTATGIWTNADWLHPRARACKLDKLTCL